MNIDESVKIIRAAFSHLIFEENQVFGDANALLYFPSIGIGVFEADNEMEEFRVKEVLAMKSVYTAEKIKPIFINIKEENYNVGQVIQDILLEGRFAPGLED